MSAIKKPEWSFYPAWIFMTILCVPIAFIIDLIILKIITIWCGAMAVVAATFAGRWLVDRGQCHRLGFIMAGDG